ncbi:MAG: hypothetical protein ACI9TB_001513 [Parasphingorhabdus sp.]|jgi:hypothetical protein|uniref:hypothetical protein n=1 Tax=Parasphingorhabdus sp. TaxID=2709688 RepID=UPI0039E45729|tara:strand:+ start:2201 stop:3067 length:867 start_codon:yes stop_codon:yes gene_type:complete
MADLRDIFVMTRFAHLLKSVAAATIFFAASPLLAQAKIPIEISWIGSESPESIEIVGVGKLTKSAAQKTFAGMIADLPAAVKFFDIDVQYIEDTYPLTVRVLPTTKIVSFTLSREKPESCSDPYVKRIERSTTSKTQALNRALTAGYMLSRPGPNNICRTHKKRAIRARYERYVNLATYSSIFSVPKTIKTEFLIAYNNSDYAKNRIKKYDKSEYEREVITLQSAALQAGKTDNGLAADATQLIIARAATSPDIKAAYFSKIDQSVVEKQLTDFKARAERDAQITSER